jgi:stress response protein YsnF
MSTMTIDIDDPRRLRKAAVIGRDGTKLGTVAAVYYDNDTDRPAWVAVRTGLFGLDVSLVPLAAAHLRGDDLHVPFDKERLRSAPHHDPGLELSPQDERDLFDHYGVPYGARGTSAASGTQIPAERVGPAVPGAAVAGGDRAAADGTGAPAGTDPSAPTAGDAMTRSEEQLRVRTESQPVMRVRLRKHLVTEYEQVTVAVRREEIRVEHLPPGRGTATGHADPAADAVPGDAVPGDAVPGDAVPGDAVPGDAVPGAVVAGDEHEIVLHAERPVVRTERVPVERVRLRKHTVTEQQQVGGEVRKERIELDSDRDVDTGVDTDVDPGGPGRR